MMVHDRSPPPISSCFCDVVARDPFFIIGAQAPAPVQVPPISSASGSRRYRKCRRPGSARPTTCGAPASIRHGSTASATARWLRTRPILRTGKVDAIQVFQPYAEQLIALGGGPRLVRRRPRAGLTAYTTLVTRRHVLAERRDELLKMTRAIHRTLGWFAVTPANEIVRAVTDFFPDVDQGIFAAAIEALSRARPVGARSGDPPRGLRSPAGRHARGRPCSAATSPSPPASTPAWPNRPLRQIRPPATPNQRKLRNNLPDEPGKPPSPGRSFPCSGSHITGRRCERGEEHGHEPTEQPEPVATAARAATA